MNIPFILNDPPYGTERSYNAIRLANAITRQDPSKAITLFLMADAVGCARKAQKTPEGYYNLEHMLGRFTGDRHRVLLCGMCMDARGLTIDDVVAGAGRSSMDALAAITLEADKVLVF